MRPFLLDTPLVALLIVGNRSPSLIAGHKRLTEFAAKDYHLLVDRLARAGLIVLAHSLAEASNTLFYRSLLEPRRADIAEQFRLFVERTRESHVSSSVAVQRSEFTRLGLTDCALIEAAGAQGTLLTTDGSLFEAAIRARRPAEHFMPSGRRH